MLDQSAVGLSLHQRFRYDWRDVILYNISVGADAEELSYVYERDLKAVPTFGVLPCAATFGTDPFYDRPVMPTRQIPGLRADGTLHMAHRLALHHPVPVEAELEIDKTISGVYDRGEGKGAMVQVEIAARDREGVPLFTNTMSYLNRWAGGFGGERPPASSIAMPDCAPDQVIAGSFPSNAPLLYRLTGDTYPLHVDPKVAHDAGFPRPIVHGLCSLGYACRLLTAQLFSGQPERMTLIENQFRNVALPGDTFAIQIWTHKANQALFRMVNQNGSAILDRGRICWRA